MIAQVGAQTIPLTTQESIFLHTCRVEDLNYIGWPKFDSKTRNHEYVSNPIHGFSYKLKFKANEKKLDHNSTVDEQFTPFELLKKFVNRKRLAYEVLPKSSNDVKQLESEERYTHQTRSQTCYQTDPDKKNTGIY